MLLIPTAKTTMESPWKVVGEETLEDPEQRPAKHHA